MNICEAVENLSSFITMAHCSGVLTKEELAWAEEFERVITQYVREKEKEN